MVALGQPRFTMPWEASQCTRQHLLGGILLRYSFPFIFILFTIPAARTCRPPTHDRPDAKVSSYLGAGIGFCPGVPRYDLTLAVELVVGVGRQTIISPWHQHCLLARGAKA